MITTRKIKRPLKDVRAIKIIALPVVTGGLKDCNFIVEYYRNYYYDLLYR